MSNTVTVEIIVFYLLLLDSVSCNLMVLLGSGWYVEHFRTLSRWFPPAGGWAIYYLLLVAWMGFIMHQAGILWS